MQDIEVNITTTPFPHAIFRNFYDNHELGLIWEELNFYTRPNKLLDVEEYAGVVGFTNARAIILDDVYDNNRSISNILTVNRKIFNEETLEIFSNISDCCSLARDCNWDVTKVRYYHHGEYYKPHIDKAMPFLAFSYFHKQPKRFTGGELVFPKYDYSFDCDNNSLIIFPGWVEHGVNEVSIQNSDYYDGYGRYAITSFFGFKLKE
tara:strand:- start:552 stop:1169 length:618 start_codon:yes stop_codon:yes gene_type:complete